MQQRALCITASLYSTMTTPKLLIGILVVATLLVDAVLWSTVHALDQLSHPGRHNPRILGRSCGANRTSRYVPDSKTMTAGRWRKTLDEVATATGIR